MSAGQRNAARTASPIGKLMFAALISAATGGRNSASNVAGPASATSAITSTRRMRATNVAKGSSTNGVRAWAATGV